jgi:hypothetical protein
MAIEIARTESGSIRQSDRPTVSTEHSRSFSAAAPISRRKGFSPSLGSRALKLRIRRSPV